jgi:pSer/pThr/pTyr-binding forkhead associated (FHA) protein
VAFLKVEKGSIPGQILELHGERMVLGRHPNCHIVLDNAAVSRQHAQILESHGQYYIEDLRSRNATLINGKPIVGRSELHDCDHISVCDVQFSFFLYAPGDNMLEHRQSTDTESISPDNPNPNADTLPETPALPPAKEMTPAADKSSIIGTLSGISCWSKRPK